MSTRRFARSVISGRFVSMAYAFRFPDTTVVETVHVSGTGVRRLKGVARPAATFRRP